MAMSRSRARLNVTSSPPSRMLPEVGNSSPATIRKVVVLPQPEGPRRQKKSPSSTVKLVSFTATKEPNCVTRVSTRISAMAYSGNLVTKVNITTPIRVVMKEYV
jgi:hypothetical protein